MPLGNVKMGFKGLHAFSLFFLFFCLRIFLTRAYSMMCRSGCSMFTCYLLHRSAHNMSHKFTHQQMSCTVGLGISGTENVLFMIKRLWVRIFIGFILKVPILSSVKFGKKSTQRAQLSNKAAGFAIWRVSMVIQITLKINHLFPISVQRYPETFIKIFS